MPADPTNPGPQHATIHHRTGPRLIIYIMHHAMLCCLPSSPLALARITTLARSAALAVGAALVARLGACRARALARRALDVWAAGALGPARARRLEVRLGALASGAGACAGLARAAAAAGGVADVRGNGEEEGGGGKVERRTARKASRKTSRKHRGSIEEAIEKGIEEALEKGIDITTSPSPH